MDEDQAFQRIATERRDLAETLTTLTDEQWAQPSLCGAWTVKDVAAHVMLGPTTKPLTFVKAMAKARGSFDRANEQMTAERATRSTDELVELLHRHAKSRFVPPTHDFHAPLSDLLIHRVDMLAPLGLDYVRPTKTVWDDVLDFLVTPRATRGFVRKGIPQLTYVATDVSWKHGAGPRVEGPGRALALALTGRTPYLDQLEGPGSDALKAWATR